MTVKCEKIKKKCLACEKEYLKYPSTAKDSKYCSRKCNGISQQKRIIFNCDFCNSSVIRQLSHYGKRGKAYAFHFCNYKCFSNWERGRILKEKSGLWKGETAGYSAMHLWIGKYFPKKNQCEWCLKLGKTEWANLNHSFSRDIEDYAELCISCHRSYDITYAWYLKKSLKVSVK